MGSCSLAGGRCPRIDVYSRADVWPDGVFSGPLPEIIVGKRFLRLDLDGAREQLGQKPHGQRPYHNLIVPAQLTSASFSS